MKRKFIFALQTLCMIMALSFGVYGNAVAATTVNTAEALYTAIEDAGTSTVEIVLQNDISIGSIENVSLITVGSGKDVTIDLNDKKLEFSGTTIIAVDAGTLTIKNGDISTISGNVALYANNGGTLCLENVLGTASTGAVIYSDSSDIYLNGVTLTALDTTSPVIQIEGTSNVYGSDGTEIDSIESMLVEAYNTGALLLSNGPSQSTPVTVQVTGTYSVVIPESIDFGSISYTNDAASKIVTKTANITAEYVVAGDNQKVKVLVYGDGTDGKFVLKNGTNEITYTVKDANGNVLSANGTAATFTAAGSSQIILELDRSMLNRAGNYQGNLNFDISLE